MASINAMEADHLLGNTERPKPNLFVRSIIEFLGTLMFVFFGAGTASHFAGGDIPLELTAVSAAHGVITMVLIYKFASLSGAYFNAGPVVLHLLQGKLKILDAFGYTLAQAAGALVGAAMLLPLYGVDHPLGTPSLGQIHVLKWNETLSTNVLIMREVTWYGGLCTELFGTFFLAIAAVLSSKNRVTQQALIIGATLFCIFLVGAPLDGAAMNPWRWLGPAVVSRAIKHQWYWWIYIVGPIVGFSAGGLLASWHMLQAEEHHRHD